MSPADDEDETPKGLVPAVARAARLLEVLAEAKAPQTATAIAVRLGLPKSTAHGLCMTLAQAGLVERFENGGFHLGIRVVDLAHAYLSRTDLSSEFARIVEALRPLPEESVVLSVLDGADVVYVACRNGARPFGFHFQIGMRLPAHCTATGKAMLATLADDRLAGLFQHGPMPRLTDQSITEPAPLRANLATSRAQGYAVDNEETRLGMVCVGAPVFGASEMQAIAAVGVSLPKLAFDGEQRSIAIDTVRQLAARLSRRMGASIRSPAPD